MAISGACHDFPNGLFLPEKIAVPVVVRERLITRVVGPCARKVTLVAAPLGYGKTVFLTQVHAALGRQGRRCLWLSLNGDMGDNSLLELLSAAADRAGLPRAVGSTVTVHSLLNRIEHCAEPVAVVIDCVNQHVFIDSHALLWQLIHNTPDHCRFVIATETALQLPELRLTASGLLHKIGTAELALNEVDIAALGEMTSLPAWISTLNERVEGWPAIVQLALSRFREQPDMALPLLHGCHYEIGAFLNHDVLRNLEPRELARLLDASIVEEICGPLLDALSGSNDGAATLDTFVARGVPVRESPRHGWFRLHPLLRDYLHDRLQRYDSEQLTLLHQRAATWLLACGDEHAALRHATATGNIDFLRVIYQRLTVTHTVAPVDDDRFFPEDKLSEASSDLTLDPKWRAIFDLIQCGQISKARASIAEARGQPPLGGRANGSDIRPVPWELTYTDLIMRVFDDRLPRPDQLEALRDRLMRTPGVPPSIPAAVSEFIIVSRFRRGDLSEMAESDHTLWHTSALAPPQCKIYVLMELGIAALERGDLELATRHVINAQARAIQAFGPSASQAHAAGTLLAEIAFERGDHEASAQMLRESFPNLQHEEIWFNLAASAYTTGTAEISHRSWAAALEALELPQSLSSHIGLWRLPPLLVAQRLRLACLRSEDLDAARKDRATLSNHGILDLGELDGAGFGWRVSVPAQLAVIRFDLADRRHDAALARALALRPILESRRHVRRLIELNLLQGRASIEMGDQIAGHALIRDALRLSVDTGMVQSFLDEVRFLGTLVCELSLAQDISSAEREFLDKVLVKFSRPLPRPTRYVANGRTFDLSSREAQLLRALVTGKTFKEISFALNISVNTTKMHRTRLYRKLGCNSRSHAIALAHELIAN